GLEITGTKRDWDQISRRRASIEKAQKLLGYEPHTNINEGLENIIAWFKTNWDNIERSASF
ncbi:MAG: dTDP-glucose 4,6-dehydratase, partial [Parcubacteria group bacterium GW2011_GWA2_47_7]